MGTARRFHLGVSIPRICLAAQNGSAIVVGYSYKGVVITEACTDPDHARYDQQLNEIAVSDRTPLAGLTQFRARRHMRVRK